MPSRYDTLTLIAIAVLVYSASSFIHEGLGHGGACLLVGGHPLEMSSVHFDGESDYPKIVSSGGTIANLITGALCWLALRLLSHGAKDPLRSQRVHLRYFVWLLMTVNLLQGGGYFLFSGIGNIGDWAEIIRGLQPAWAWRIGLAALGAVTYLIFVRIALRVVLQFLPDAGEPRWRSAKKLMLVPYIAGGVLSCIAGMLNPVGMILVAISAAAASLGGTSGLAWMWKFLRGDKIPSPSSVHSGEDGVGLPRSIPWIVAATAAGIVFVGVLGPGIRFHR
jgi:hypothetical protein